MSRQDCLRPIIRIDPTTLLSSGGVLAIGADRSTEFKAGPLFVGANAPVSRILAFNTNAYKIDNVMIDVSVWMCILLA